MSKRELQEYEVANLVDDALASDSWNDHMLSRYVYEFKQGSQTIRGLTATAIAHIALESGISIESVEIKEICQNGKISFNFSFQRFNYVGSPNNLRCERRSNC